MTDLLFVRHAQTDMAGTFCGHSDPPINSVGEKQLADLLFRLRPEMFSAIYSSDLLRAVNTAKAIAERFVVPLTVRPRLREINFGDWEGMTWRQIEHRDSVYACRWMKDFPTLPAPGGEKYAVFEQRVLEEVENLVRLGEDKRIVIVTHGGVMRVVLQKLLDYSEKQSWVLTKSYCSYFALTRKAVASNAPEPRSTGKHGF